MPRTSHVKSMQSTEKNEPTERKKQTDEKAKSIDVRINNLTEKAEGKGKWVFQYLERNNDQCTTRFSLGAPFVYYIPQ